MNYFLRTSVFCSLLFFQGCSDNASVNIFDEKITQKKIECMRLVVFPPDENIEKTLRKLYDFDETCSMKLEVSKKSGIVCNSNQNSQTKAIVGLPSSYLRMQIREDRLLYSYYIDLENSVSDEDVQVAFERIEKDLKF